MSEETKLLITDFKNFRGVDFTIQSLSNEDVISDVISETTKNLNLISVLKLMKHIKENMNILKYHIREMNYYRHYGENIEDSLDDNEKDGRGDNDNYRYSCGGNFAFFLQLQDTGLGIVFSDNNKAADILKSEYDKNYPDNTIIFDSEMSFCYVYTNSREEAKQFMTWMDEKYFKPWVEKNLDGWDEFVELHNNSCEEYRLLVSEFINSF